MTSTREVVNGAGAMRDLGAQVAGSCRAGDVIVLVGPLGAGKTTFTQGLARGLRVEGAVTSPTFVIAREHPPVDGGPGLVHVDAYRLGGTAELDDLDLDTALSASVTAVEWGEPYATHFDRPVVYVTITRDADESDLRTVTIEWPEGRRP
jgi:tRNA threonylcarbamoyladenosine biosynthesis protein TsaE